MLELTEEINSNEIEIKSDFDPSPKCLVVNYYNLNKWSETIDKSQISKASSSILVNIYDNNYIHLGKKLT